MELHIIFSLKILFDVQGGIALSQARGIEAHLINQWMVKGRKKYSGKWLKWGLGKVFEEAIWLKEKQREC